MRPEDWLVICETYGHMTDGKKFSTDWVVCDYCQTEWRRPEGERTETRQA